MVLSVYFDVLTSCLGLISDKILNVTGDMYHGSLLGLGLNGLMLITVYTLCLKKIPRHFWL